MIHICTLILLLGFLIIFKGSCCAVPWNKSVILESTGPMWAREMYRDHGVYWGNKVQKINHICKPVDNKTNYIYGDEICRQAGPKILGYGHNLHGRVRCVSIPTTKYEKHPFKKNIRAILEMKNMAECNFISDDGKSYCFYIFNGPKKHYYYVFVKDEESVHGTTVIACLNIYTNKSFITPIKIVETTDSYDADNIFGVFGRLSDKKPGQHLCLQTNPKNLEDICLAVMNTKYMNLSDKKLSNPTECIVLEIARKIFHPITLESTKMVQKVLRCNYIENNTIVSFMVLEGPDTGLYYIAKPIKESGTPGNKAVIAACIHLNLPKPNFPLKINALVSKSEKTGFGETSSPR